MDYSTMREYRSSSWVLFWIFLPGMAFFSVGRVATNAQWVYLFLSTIILTIVCLVANFLSRSASYPTVKLIFSICGLLALIAAIWNVTEMMSYSTAYQNVAYTVKSDEATVHKVYGGDELVVLEDSFKDSPVTSISDRAFEFRRAMHEVVLPSQLKTVGKYAFVSCTGLKEITLPNSVNKVEIYAFQNCKSLERITIPPSVTEIPKNAFKGCPKDMVIVGEPGSAAQTFAEKYYTFEPLG